MTKVHWFFKTFKKMDRKTLKSFCIVKNILHYKMAKTWLLLQIAKMSKVIIWQFHMVHLQVFHIKFTLKVLITTTADDIFRLDISFKSHA